MKSLFSRSENQTVNPNSVFGLWHRLLHEESGLLTFEWTLLLSLLLLGIISGLGVMRDSLVVHFFNTAQAFDDVDPAYEINPYESRLTGEATDPLYTSNGSSFGSDGDGMIIVIE